MLSPHTTKKTKVLIVDDNEPVRRALALVISQLPDFELCGSSGNASEALSSIDSLKPDIAIIDISLKDTNGVELVKEIKTVHDHVSILVWSLHGEQAYAELAIRAGAMGYITKDRAIEGMTDALRQIAAGKPYLNPAIATKLDD
jgi:DNA-binding NarL/FixJ family response regulator